MSDSPPDSRRIARQKNRIHTMSLGERKISVRGLTRAGLHDLYYLSMTISWPQFYVALAMGFSLINIVFAGLYSLQPGGIANQVPAGFWGSFFFSVETLATVGYGDMHPTTYYTHWVATAEIFIGMMSIALMTGVTFARFARPRARVVFSRHPVISLFNGKPALMIRAANERKSLIVEATAKMYVLLDHVTDEGRSLRRLHDLKLVRNEQPMFMLSWTIFHIIDESSPLWGHDAASLEKLSAGFALSIAGVDEVTTQEMHSRTLFSHADLRWDHVFEDMLHVDEQGREVVDYERIHMIRPA